jgi:hypothetical protein
MDILSENSKKEYPKLVTELLRLEKKRFVHGVCYVLNKIAKLFKKKVVNIQNIKYTFRVKRYIQKSRGGRCDRTRSL